MSAEISRFESFMTDITKLIEANPKGYLAYMFYARRLFEQLERGVEAKAAVESAYRITVQALSLSASGNAPETQKVH